MSLRELKVLLDQVPDTTGAGPAPRGLARAGVERALRRVERRARGGRGRLAHLAVRWRPRGLRAYRAAAGPRGRRAGRGRRGPPSLAEPAQVVLELLGRELVVREADPLPALRRRRPRRRRSGRACRAAARCRSPARPARARRSSRARSARARSSGCSCRKRFARWRRVVAPGRPRPRARARRGRGRRARRGSGRPAPGRCPCRSSRRT